MVDLRREEYEVIPDAVKQRPDGYWELNVDPIHWATVNAVKELAAETKALKVRLSQAEAEAEIAIMQAKSNLMQSDTL